MLDVLLQLVPLSKCFYFKSWRIKSRILLYYGICGLASAITVVHAKFQSALLLLELIPIRFAVMQCAHALISFIMPAEVGGGDEFGLKWNE